MLEVPRAEEELEAEDLSSSSKAGSLDAELAPDEGKQDTLAKPKKAKDLLKGEQQGGTGTASQEWAVQESTVLEYVSSRGSVSLPKGILV